MPPARYPPPLRTPTAAASRAAARASSSSRPTNTTSRPGPASHASRVPNPARCAVTEIAPGTWASSKSRSVRTSTTSAPAACRASSCPAVSGRSWTSRETSGPRLISTISRKLGGWGPMSASDRATKVSASGSASRALWARSKPIVELIFWLMPGPPHIEPPRCPGHTSTSGGRVRSALVEAAEDVARALVGLHGQVRPRHPAHEQRVAGQDRPRLLAARGVGQAEAGVLGAVPRRVQRADPHVAQDELPAVVDRLVRVGRAGDPVDVDRRAGGLGQPPVAGHVVGVGVRLQDVRDLHPGEAGQAQVLVHLEPRVDDRRHAGVLVADQVRGAAQVVVDELAEDHGRLPSGPGVIQLPRPAVHRPPRLRPALRPAARSAPARRPAPPPRG